MASINKDRIRKRVSAIWDGLQASQGTHTSVKEYTGVLEKHVDIHKERMGDANDFARDFGAGI